jgi:predicted phosphodiesterase
MQEQGLYTNASESSFKSNRDIEAKYNPIHKEWVNPYDEITFEDQIEEAIKRQEWRNRQERIPEEAEVVIKTDRPIGICNLADSHMGGAKVEYEYLKYLVDTIVYNDNAFCVLGGDLAETISWNSGQNDSILSFEQQHEMLYALLKKLKGKIIAAVKGNHNWEERNWVSKYQEFLRNADAPLFENLGWLTLITDNEEEQIPYYTVLGHQLKGYSYHNPNHPQGRFNKKVEGCDIIISNHTHKDGVQGVAKAMFGGDFKRMTFINGFTLKKNDKFLRGKGNPNSPIGANWLYLSPYKKQHMAIPTTELAIETMGWE